MSNDLISLLTENGLPVQQAKVYLACLKLGKATVQQIAQAGGIKRTSVYNFIESMIDQGYLIREKVGKRDVFLPCGPDMLINRARNRLHLCQEMVPLLLQLYEKKHEPRIRHLVGPAQMIQIFEEELLCNSEVLYIWPGITTYQTLGVPTKIAALDKERVRRGIKVRSIRFKEGRFETNHMSVGPEQLKEVRYAPRAMSTKMGMVIYDTGKVGFFSSQAESFALIVSSQELYDLSRILFGVFWSIAKVSRR